jgi:hypothetical protein
MCLPKTLGGTNRMSISSLPLEPSPDSEVRTLETKKYASRDHKRTTVRFTDAEFERIKEEAKLSGLSLPLLLKKSHFAKKKLQLLFSETERHLVCKELRAVGNNVNQIARRVNSGALEGWHKEFQEVVKMISELHQMAAGAYGLR